MPRRERDLLEIDLRHVLVLRSRGLNLFQNIRRQIVRVVHNGACALARRLLGNGNQGLRRGALFNRFSLLDTLNGVSRLVHLVQINVVLILLQQLILTLELGIQLLSLKRILGDLALGVVPVDPRVYSTEPFLGAQFAMAAHEGVRR